MAEKFETTPGETSPSAEAQAKKTANEARLNKSIDEFYSTEISMNNNIKTLPEQVTTLEKFLSQSQKIQLDKLLQPYKELVKYEPPAPTPPDKNIVARIEGLTEDSKNLKERKAQILLISARYNEITAFMNEMNKIPGLQNTQLLKKMADTLIQPVQRGMRYNLLLSAISDNMRKMDITSDNFKRELDETKKYAMDINTKAGDQEVITALKNDLHQKLAQLENDKNGLFAKLSSSYTAKTTHKIQALTELIKGIEAVGPDLSAVRTYLELAKDVPGIVPSKGVFHNPMEKLLSSHADKIEQRYAAVERDKPLQITTEGTNFEQYHQQKIQEAEHLSVQTVKLDEAIVSYTPVDDQLHTAKDVPLATPLDDPQPIAEEVQDEASLTVEEVDEEADMTAELVDNDVLDPAAKDVPLATPLDDPQLIAEEVQDEASLTVEEVDEEAEMTAELVDNDVLDPAAKDVPLATPLDESQMVAEEVLDDSNLIVEEVDEDPDMTAELVDNEELEPGAPEREATAEPGAPEWGETETALDDMELSDIEEYTPPTIHEDPSLTNKPPIFQKEPAESITPKEAEPQDSEKRSMRIGGR